VFLLKREARHLATTSSSASNRVLNRLLFFPKWILIIALVLIAARLALPWVLKTYINRGLNSIPGYYGQVADVDVALWRGAYKIKNIELLKTHGSEKEPLFAANLIDISLDWHALLNRRLETKISLVRPRLQFIERSSKSASQTSVDASWQDQIKKLVPFRINRFLVSDGLVRYKDETKTPKINIFFDEMNLAMENIDNAAHSGERLPTDVDLSARLLKSGTTKLAGRMNFLSKPFEGDLKASIRDLDLKEINDFTKAYGDFDFEKGKFALTLELAATKTRYEGYAKTLMKDVQVLDWTKERKEGKSVGHLLWEGLVGGIMNLFKNHERNQFAARIPISGSRKEMTIDKWSTVGSILRNTFVQALSPKFEDSVNFKDVAKKPAPADDKNASTSGATTGATNGSTKGGGASPLETSPGAPDKIHR
jgi:hypothetical protein